MVIVNLIIFLLLINILILTTISNLHLNIFFKFLNKLINSDIKTVNKYLKNMNVYVKLPFFNLLVFLVLKIILILIIPFASVIYLLLLIFTTLSNEKDLIRNISCKSQELNIIDKEDWIRIFNKFNIDSPKVYGIINKNYKLNVLDKGFSYDKKYIFKPIYGGRGRDILYDSYNNIKKKNIKFDEPMVIQERIYDCKYGSNRSRHFRINTYYNKKLGESKLINFFMMTSGKGEITSNLKSGASIVDCEDLSNCNILSKKEKRLLVNIKDKLLLLHTELKYPVFGWDIVLDCDTAYVLEGNICPGTAKLNKKSEDIYKKLFYSDY